MGKVIQGTSTPGQEFTFLRKDGSKFIGLIYASPNIHQNKTVGIRGAIIDITERKRAEEQIHRQSKLLAAINSIFYETLTADSEETVANTCLKVAQEMTDSKFGFIGEITPGGSLYDNRLERSGLGSLPHTRDAGQRVDQGYGHTRDLGPGYPQRAVAHCQRPCFLSRPCRHS